MSYQFHKISYYNLYNFTQFSIIQFSYNFSYDTTKKTAMSQKQTYLLYNCFYTSLIINSRSQANDPFCVFEYASWTANLLPTVKLGTVVSRLFITLVCDVMKTVNISTTDDTSKKTNNKWNSWRKSFSSYSDGLQNNFYWHVGNVLTKRKKTNKQKKQQNKTN